MHRLVTVKPSRLIAGGAVTALCVLARLSVGHAQTVGDSSGTLEGVVRDHQGAAVAGVTICVAGPLLSTNRCDTSDTAGAFRLAALSPGRHVVTLALPGFDIAGRSDVMIRVGETTTVPLSIDLTRPRTSVDVVSTPALDRLATAMSASYSDETIGQLPGPRSMGAFLAATPAVLFSRHDVGGNTALGLGPFGAYGTTGFSRPALEGINVANVNQLGLSLDYASFDQVWVGTGAYGPEWATPAVHLQMLTRSGGDHYRGGLYAAWEDERWQSRNIDADQIRRGVSGGSASPTDANRLHLYRDLSADTGGFVVRQRAWWYASGRSQTVALRRINFPSGPVETRTWSVTGKVTARIDDRHRLVAFARPERVTQPVRLDGFLAPGETAFNSSIASTTASASSGLVWKGEWNAVLSPALFAEVRVGQFLGDRDETPNGEPLPRREDRGSFAVGGANREWRERLHRDQVTATISRVFGRNDSHLLKAGGEALRTVSTEQWIRGYAGDLLHVFNNGRPSEVYFFRTPSRSESGQWWLSAFAGDTWQVNDRLTVNLGLRFDRFRLFLPEQSHPATRFAPEADVFAAVSALIERNAVAPRIGVSVSLDRDRRTVAKATYGLYWLPPGTDLAFNANPNARVWFHRHAWSDASSPNGLWDPGEEGVLLEQRGGRAAESIDPALRLPYVHEVTARLERDAGNGLIVRTGVVWRGERRLAARQPAGWSMSSFSATVPWIDPGVDNEVGTADDGPMFLLRDLESSSASPSVVRNVPDSDSDYVTWEAAAERRARGRWSLAASFAVTFNRDQAAAYLGQPVRSHEVAVTPNDLIHTDASGRHVFTSWTAKAFGTYEAPWQVRVTPLLRHQAGQPSARTFQAPLPNVGPVRVLAEPVGTRRQDHVTLVDVRVERPLWFGSRRITVFMEAFNVLNANAEQNLIWASGPAFLRPSNVVSPRIARAGLTLDW